MNCKIHNKTDSDMTVVENLLKEFFPYAQKRLNFNKPVDINFISDKENYKDPLGKTAYYDPDSCEIAVYVDGRHPKDILRSISHELVHHSQNCRGEFDNTEIYEDGYAQKDKHLREMEAEAYLLGNGFLIRDWTDQRKLKESKKMTKSELTEIITKAVLEIFEEGKKPDFLDLDKDGDKKEPMKKAAKDAKKSKMDEETLEEEGDIFAPNHYCVHHGGVQHNGAVHMAEAVQHNYNEELGKVTHYDMKLEDGTILENVAVEDIQITSATLEGMHSGKRDDGHKPVKKMKKAMDSSA